MTVEVSLIIALIGCLVGVAGFFAGRDRGIKETAQWRGGVDAKLNQAIEIVADVRALTLTVASHDARIAALEKERSR